jgi:hypothetical protein
MSKPFSTYEQVGKKEDVSDVISTLNRQDTPFSDSLGTRQIHNVIYDWQEDEQLPGGDNAKVEGFEAVDEALTTTSKLMNTTQIFSRTFKTSGTLGAIDMYGRKDELARQIVKKGLQLKQDYEYACIARDGGMVLGNDTDTPRRFASAHGLVAAGNRISNATTGANPAPRALQEATLRAAIRKSYDEGANATCFLVAPLVAEQAAEFNGNAERTRETTAAKATTINHVVDVYITALGTLTIETARLMKADLGLLFKKGTYRKAVMKNRSWFKETLAKTGDSTRTMLAGEYGLQIDNSKGAVIVTGIDPNA